MTALEAYDAGLIELNKVHAPSLLLEDFNYFFNKAIQQYINLVYTRLEINQQALDDIRALKRFKVYELTQKPVDYGYETHYSLDLPTDYQHLANCVVQYKSKEKDECKNDYIIKSFPARRLSPDLLTQIVNNSYLKPKYNRPYYNLFDGYKTGEKDPETKKEIEVEIDLSSKIEIYIGGGLDNYAPSVYIEYIKVPEQVKITEEMLTGKGDKVTLEFPDYVCYEIINIFVRLVMENASNPRLQTNMPLNNTIAVPQQS